MSLRLLWIVPFLLGGWGASAAARQAWWVGGEAAWYPIWVLVGLAVAAVSMFAGRTFGLLFIAVAITWHLFTMPRIEPWPVGVAVWGVAWAGVGLVLDRYQWAEGRWRPWGLSRRR